MKRVARTAVGLALLAVLALLASCLWRPAAAPPLSPHDACRAVSETLAAAVSPGQSLLDLQARGIRVRTPLNFAPGTVPAPTQPSGAAVQGMIGPDGAVIAGSARTIKGIGEPQTARAVEVAVLSMSFDVDAVAKPTAPIPFTMTYALCPRS
jgi:hypothetical protein